MTVNISSCVVSFPCNISLHTLNKGENIERMTVRSFEETVQVQLTAVQK